MPYAAQSDLVPQRLTAKQLLQLTADAGAVTPDATVIAGKLAEASAIVDSYCGQRYVLPLQQSVMATSLAADVATYLLYQRRGQVKAGTAQSDLYVAAMARLKAIAAGDESLDIPANATPQGSSGEVLVPQRHDIFTRANVFGEPRFECCDEAEVW